MSAGERRGHLLALFTIMVWGTTFLSTSVLLRDFTPLEILIIRMALGIAALTVARPRRLRLKSRRHEWLFAGAGLTGVSMYFLLENYALTFTYSANCSVIISTAPFFVAIAVRLFLGGAPMGRSFSGGRPSGGASSSSTTMPSTRRRPSGTLTRAPTDTSAPSGTR